MSVKVAEEETTTVQRDLMTAGEVARMFGVTREAVRSWVNDGRLSEVATFGRLRVFRRSQVEALLQARGARRRFPQRRLAV